MVVDGRGALGLRFNEYVEEDGQDFTPSPTARRTQARLSSITPASGGSKASCLAARNSLPVTSWELRAATSNPIARVTY